VKVDDDSEGIATGSRKNNANVFANAASVLSMVAEEVQLDDNLEKELANEVELWRMETSSAPAVAMKAHHGKRDHDGNGLNALTVTSGNDRPLLVPFDNRSPRNRSISPPLRTQVSLSNRTGPGFSANSIGSPRRSAKAADEPAERQHALENRDRLGAATPLRQRGGGTEAKEAPEPRLDFKPDTNEEILGTVDNTSLGQAVSAIETMSAPACLTCTGEDEAAGDAAAGGGTHIECDVVDISIPSLSAREVAPRLNQVASPEKAPSIAIGSSPSPESSKVAGNGLDGIQVRGFEDRQEAYASDGFAEGPPDPSADDREVDTFSSSDESAFLGFIEDPLEQERAEALWGGSPEGPFSSRLLDPDQFNVRPDRSLMF